MTDSPSYHRVNYKDRLMRDCLATLEKDGWSCYTRGMPNVIAEKGNFMRLIVLRPKGNAAKGYGIGKKREALSRVFHKCFGIKFELWDVPIEGVSEEEWV